MTLTRRQRTGYSFVLESLRAGVVGGELHDPSLPMPVQFITNSMAFFDDFTPIDLRDRMTLARLALYLRAVLRADAGDFGPLIVVGWQPRRCDYCKIDVPKGECPKCEDPYDISESPVLSTTRIRPLWESAPPTRARAR